MLSPMFNSLLQFNPWTFDRFDIWGDLAESWTQVDAEATIWEFKLKPHATFWDGSRVTAEDVAYSWDRITGNTVGHPDPSSEARQYINPNYDFAEAVDERTVRIHLLHPWADFLGYAANDLILMVPKAHYEDLDAQFQDNPDVYTDIHEAFKLVMGSGPFKPVSLLDKDNWSYLKNDIYWKLDPEGRSLPYLDGMDYHVVIDRTAAQAAWEADQLDNTNWQHNGNMAPGQMKEMIDRFGDKFVAYPSACCPAGIAMKVTEPPYDDWRVRRALMLAIDRQAFNELVWSGLGLYGTWCGPPGHPLCLTEDEVLQLPGWRLPKDQDYATARQLLAEAGYADGFSTTFITRNELAAQDEGPVLIENLRNLSIEVEHIAMDRATAFEAQAAGDYDLFSSGAGSGVITPNQYLNQFFLITGRTNPFDWEYCGPCQGEADVDLKALIRQQSQTFDPAERRAILRVIDDITLTKDTQIIQTYTKTYARLFNTEKVAGQMPTQSGYVETKAEQLWLVNP
jgi:ABC-type transport system substrate-binding protein